MSLRLLKKDAARTQEEHKRKDVDSKQLDGSGGVISSISCLFVGLGGMPLDLEPKEIVSRP